MRMTGFDNDETDGLWIQISTWDTRSKTHLPPSESIVDDVSFFETVSGYEILINFKHRRWSVKSYGSGGCEVPTKDVTIVDDFDVWHTVLFQVPDDFDKNCCRFVTKEKEQLQMNFIRYDLLVRKDKENISQYDCPSNKIRHTLVKLGLRDY